MEPNKLENQFKEQLNSREIQPSESAWDRLDSMLSAVEEKKQTRSFGWLYLAASIAVVVTVGGFFMIQKGNFIDTNKKGLVANEISKVKPKSVESSNAEKIKTTPFQNQEKNPLVVAEPIVKNKYQKSNQSFKSIHQKKSINPIISNVQNNELEKPEVIAQSEFSKVEARKEIAKQNYVNVDDLLASVQLDSKIKKASIKVNANILLSQVDGELEQTFRQKVINQISKNYQEVKVALSNRNQE